MVNYRQIRQHHLDNPRKPSPARGSKILVAGFAIIILIGTVLLALPAATESGEPISVLEALFTATSATTVTGLAVVGTEATFSTFGEIVILLLIQLGGMGFIVFSIVLFRLIGRHISLYERTLLQQNLGVETGRGLIYLARQVLVVTLSIELVGALLLFTQWVQVMDWRRAAYYSIFHSISAFCNAGFDLFSGFDDPILLSTRESSISLVTLALLITIGTLGITVIYDLISWPRGHHLSLHSRLVLPFTIFLTVMGTLMIILDEQFVDGHALAQLAPNQQWWLAFFTTVSARTAGITLVPMGDLGEASQLLVLVWMFIGGAPASMGGGIGLSTVAVLLITLKSTARGYDDARIFDRTLPTETVVKAIAIVSVSLILVVGMTFVITLIAPFPLFAIAFEVVSAFSNTGYSLGITAGLDTFSRLLIVFTMFWGRLGPLTLVVALAQRRRQTLIHYPEERIIIG